MLDELIEEAWEEESAIVDMLNAGMNALTAVRPAIHSALMAWNSMSPEQKAYLINQAKIRLNQLGSNLSGKAHQVAMQAAGSTESAKLKDKVMDVANAPGEKIYPGELAKALKILKDGGEIDYVGASAVELVGPGESAGNYREIEIKDGGISVVKYR